MESVRPQEICKSCGPALLCAGRVFITLAEAQSRRNKQQEAYLFLCMQPDGITVIYRAQLDLCLQTLATVDAALQYNPPTRVLKVVGVKKNDLKCAPCCPLRVQLVLFIFIEQDTFCELTNIYLHTVNCFLFKRSSGGLE